MSLFKTFLYLKLVFFPLSNLKSQLFKLLKGKKTYFQSQLCSAHTSVKIKLGVVGKMPVTCN